MGEGGSGVQSTRVPERVVDGKPTLFMFETCPFCWKIKALLSYKGIDFSKVEVDPMKKHELSWSEYTAVPVFIDADGTQVNDSNYILHYLNETYGQSSWFPAHGTDATHDKWMDFSGDVLGKSILPVIYKSYGSSLKAMDYVTKVDKFSKFQAFKAKWIGAFVMKMVGKSRGKLFELPAEENLDYQLDVLSSGFTGDFFGGKIPNCADFANYGILRSMQGLRGWDIVTSHKSAGPWFARMQAASGI